MNNQFFADGGGPNGVFAQVVIDLDPAVVEEAFEGGPLIQSVGDREAEQALGQAAMLLRSQGTLQAHKDHSAAGSAFGLPQGRSGVVGAQPGFDAIELVDVPQDPAADSRALCAGFVKLAPRVRQQPASVIALPRSRANAG